MGSSFFPRVVMGFMVDWDQREKRGRKCVHGVE